MAKAGLIDCIAQQLSKGSAGVVGQHRILIKCEGTGEPLGKAEGIVRGRVVELIGRCRSTRISCRSES